MLRHSGSAANRRGDQCVRMICEPGIPLRDPLSRPWQRIWVSMTGGFARLDPVDASELLRDLGSLRVAESH